MRAFDLGDLAWEHLEVDLDWKKPREVTDDADAGSCLPKEAHEYRGIYRFVRSHHMQESEKLTTERIGIAYEQTIGKRVSQYKADKVRSFRSRGQLFLTYALLDFDGKDVRRHYESVEHLLCFFRQPLWNDRKLRSLPNDAWYKVTNRGHRGDMPREIHFPALLYTP